MWTLPIPERDGDDADLNRVQRSTKGKSKYEASDTQRAALWSLYEKYDAGRGTPSAELLGKHLGDEFLEFLVGAYDQVQSGRLLSALRDRVKANARICPLCGFGEIYTLDHHLAKSVYKAFAIYVRNLVPCCHPCNHRKGAAGGEHPEEQFAHPYFDAYPMERFLVASATVNELGLKVEFSIVSCSGMTPDLLERMRYQFKRLDLNRRYEAQVVTFVSDHRLGIEDAGLLGTDAIRLWLRRAHDMNVKSFGLNDWRSALLYALALSDEFCAGGYRYAFGRRDLGA